MTQLQKPSTLPPATPDQLSAAPWSRELIKSIADDIGKDTVAYVEIMYPKAIEATSSTFKLSVRNHIHNQVMQAIELRTAEVVAGWLTDRKKHRREWLACYRKIRKEDKAVPLADAAKIRAIANHVRLRERGWLPGSGYVKNVTFTVEEAETVERALNFLADMGETVIETDTGSVT